MANCWPVDNGKNNMDIDRITTAGRVPNRFGTVCSEPKPRECQEPKFFINRIITTVNYPITTEPEKITNRNSPLLRDPQRFFEGCPRSQKHLHIGVPKQHVTGAARLQARAAPGDEQTGFREKPFQSCAGARHSKSRLRKLGEHWHLSFMAAPPRQRAFSCDIQALIVQHLSFHLLANLAAVSQLQIFFFFLVKKAFKEGGVIGGFRVKMLFLDNGKRILVLVLAKPQAPFQCRRGLPPRSITFCTSSRLGSTALHLLQNRTGTPGLAGQNSLCTQLLSAAAGICSTWGQKTSTLLDSSRAPKINGTRVFMFL